MPIDPTFISKNWNSYKVYLKTSLKSSYLIGISQFFQYHFKKLNTPRIFRTRRKLDFGEMKFAGSLVFSIRINGLFTYDLPRLRKYILNIYIYIYSKYLDLQNLHKFLLYNFLKLRYFLVVPLQGNSYILR